MSTWSGRGLGPLERSSRERTGARQGEPPQVPGLAELQEMCRNAERIARLCKLLMHGDGVIDRHQLDVGAAHELHEDDHYIWDHD